MYIIQAPIYFFLPYTILKYSNSEVSELSTIRIILKFFYILEIHDIL